MRPFARHLRRAALLAVTATALASCFSGGGSSGGGPALGAAPPEISAAGWINSDAPVTLAGLKGKVVVVEFWATWCPPCRASIPHLAETFKAKKDAGVVIVGLSDEDGGKVTPFASEMQMPYIVGYGSKTGDAYGVTGIPSAFIVGRDGKLAWSGHPMDPAFGGALEKALAGG